MTKYGVKTKTCGVYKITNIENGKFYIGASVEINARISQHFNRDARKYLNHPFYEDIRNSDYTKFTFEVLEECCREMLLEREQYYYDLLQPTYNIVRPCKVHFDNDISRKKAIENSNTIEKVLERKRKYNSAEYKDIFRSMHVDKMKRVEMLNIDNELIKTFQSMSEGARWITDNTTFKGKNKTSKIKSVCDGDRITAYGFKWRYEEV